MEIFAFKKVKELISRVYKTDDLNEIASYIKDLQHEIKRDEIFVSEIFNLLTLKAFIDGTISGLIRDLRFNFFKAFRF